MNQACPYCDKKDGYYSCDTVRMVRTRNWNGTWRHQYEDEVQYEGTKLKCLNCQETVTSFVKGLHKEIDND